MIGPRRTGVRTTALVVLTSVAGSVFLASCSKSTHAASTSTTGARATPTTSTIHGLAPNPDDSLKLNQIQVIGTHNSYHVAATGKEHQLLVTLNAAQAASRTTTQPPLTTQLTTEKIRQLELDVYRDDSGGLYASPSLRRQAGLPPYVKQFPAMAKPGTKVMHEQDVDYHSVCPVFVDCLREVKRWSDAHPGHVPVAIDVDFKDGPLIFAVPDQAKPQRWTTEAMNHLDAEIRSVFGPKDLITPDDVRGTHATLEQAVLAGGWPTLGHSRGKVMFLMANGEPYRSIYLRYHDGLKGRILFTNSKPGQPDAAYVDMDDPLAAPGQIQKLVREGYMVRTRADASIDQAQADDTKRLKAALTSGAQWISTDYPGPDGARPSLGSAYLVELPGFLVARCDPVSAPSTCQNASIEP